MSSAAQAGHRSQPPRPRKLDRVDQVFVLSSNFVGITGTTAASRAPERDASVIRSAQAGGTRHHDGGAPALAACGGSSASEGSSGGGSGSGGGSTKLSLVGFGVPKAGNDAAQAAFAKTAGGQGRHVEQLLRRRPASRAERWPAGSKADYVHFSLAPDVTRLVDAGLVSQGLGPGLEQGHRHRLGRGPRRPQGQPEGHQGLGRPREARRQDRHAQPGLVGLGPLEHPRRLRPRDGRRRQRRRRRGVPEGAVLARRRPARQRP